MSHQLQTQSNPQLLSSSKTNNALVIAHNNNRCTKCWRQAMKEMDICPYHNKQNERATLVGIIKNSRALERTNRNKTKEMAARRYILEKARQDATELAEILNEEVQLEAEEAKVNIHKIMSKGLDKMKLGT